MPSLLHVMLEFTPRDILETTKSSHVIYPLGKPKIPHPILGIFDLRCRGFAVANYSFTLDVLDLPDERDLSRGILDFCNDWVNIAEKDGIDGQASPEGTKLYRDNY